MPALRPDYRGLAVAKPPSREASQVLGISGRPDQFSFPLRSIRA